MVSTFLWHAMSLWRFWHACTNPTYQQSDHIIILKTIVEQFAIHKEKKNVVMLLDVFQFYKSLRYRFSSLFCSIFRSNTRIYGPKVDMFPWHLNEKKLFFFLKIFFTAHNNFRQTISGENLVPSNWISWNSVGFLFSPWFYTKTKGILTLAFCGKLIRLHTSNVMTETDFSTLS